MKFYTDGIYYFKTDKYIKNLRVMEINSVDEWLKKGFDWEVLLGTSCWMVKRFDELVAGEPELSGGDEPELVGHWVELDFTKKIHQVDLLKSVLHHFNNVDAVVDILNDSEVQQAYSVNSYYDGDTQIFEVSAGILEYKKKIKVNVHHLDSNYSIETV